jgi:LacI family transcriptional regulator
MMTVSRALRGTKGVSSATRDRVKLIAQKHHYTPNLLVTGIRTGLTWTAGVMMPVNHVFYSEIIAGVHDELARSSYALLLSSLPVDYSTPGESADLRHLMPLIERRVDGLIFRPTDDRATDRHLEELRRRRIPFVTVDRHLPAAHCDFVGTDDYSGGTMVARHLLELGHRHVGFLAGPDFVSTSHQRRRGFMDTILAAAGRCTTLEMQDFVDPAAARHFLALQPRPTAVFCVNDPMALVMLALARDQGVRVPQDLSVVGFADLPEASVVTPRLTTVRQDPQAIGRRAAQLLLHRISAETKSDTFEMIQLTPTLAVRESTAAVGG